MLEKLFRKLLGNNKKYTLELGGKAANIIFEDAAIDQAIEGIVNAYFLIRDMFVVQAHDCLFRKVLPTKLHA